MTGSKLYSYYNLPYQKIQYSRSSIGWCFHIISRQRLLRVLYGFVDYEREKVSNRQY